MFIVQCKLVSYKLSEVTFPHTEGRRPECEYEMNNNSRRGSKRSGLVIAK